CWCSIRGRWSPARRAPRPSLRCANGSTRRWTRWVNGRDEQPMTRQQTEAGAHGTEGQTGAEGAATRAETPDLYGAYPRLSEHQIAALAALGGRRATREGEVLYREGE